MWAAIRAGWRSPYVTATRLTAGLAGSEGFSRYVVSIPPTADGLDQAEKIYQQNPQTPPRGSPHLPRLRPRIGRRNSHDVPNSSAPP